MNESRKVGKNQQEAWTNPKINNIIGQPMKVLTKNQQFN